jgi:hypothetical protein
MERTSDVTAYIGFACFFGTTVNAAFNVVSLVYAGNVAWDALFPTLLQWWVPNALAALVITPFIVTWATPSTIRWNSRLTVEAVLCGTGLVLGTLISFNSWFVYGIQNYPLAYLPFPFVKIRAANADAPDAQQYFAGRRLRNRADGEVEFAGRSAFNHAHGKTSAQLELVVGAWIHELLVPRWRPCQYAKLARCSRLVNLSDKL